ncbi:MAG: UDP-2,3-diacetamido-2,3-dideoxy-D-glucuronate 2-epimerase [Pelotomaculum sp. PtaU1.Bin065]|nr:MAG: UDP-2,3-diacetamido-2,3-dideoxy-D-glucuronate 2-epimerase [Pelotomaculum sp. PtaU1.Bin065]
MKIVTVVGARPQFIKAAAVSRAIRKYNSNRQANRIEEIIVHTGQHYDYNMSEVFFEELDIPRPDYNLEVGSGPHGQQTGRMLEAIEKVLDGERPDWVLVYGDTNSTLAGALAAVKMHIPVAHVEAGLRSFNRKMPEEINRVLTDHVSTLLFCPTVTAVQNLEREEITKGVYNVGDVMYDCMLYYKNKVEGTPTLNLLRLKPKYFILVTIHRAENTDNLEVLSELLYGLDEISVHMTVIIPLHPRTRKELKKINITLKDNVRFIEPLSYLQMIEMENNASIIVTDSGGVQREAYFLGTPCLTIRNETEWIETLQNGLNILCGTSKEAIVSAFNNIVKRKIEGNKIDFFGNGRASELVLSKLINSYQN